MLRRRGDLVIAETTHGLSAPTAGVDRSNVSRRERRHAPRRPRPLGSPYPGQAGTRQRGRDRRGRHRHLRAGLEKRFGRRRHRRLGTRRRSSTCGARTDSFGQDLEVTEIAIADEIAAAADLVMGKATGSPAPWCVASMSCPATDEGHRSRSGTSRTTSSADLTHTGATAPRNHSTVLRSPRPMSSTAPIR